MDVTKTFFNRNRNRLVFARLSSQAILEDTEGELERKFKILRSEYGADLSVSRLPLKVLRFRDFLRQLPKLNVTKSSAIDWLKWIYR